MPETITPPQDSQSYRQKEVALFKKGPVVPVDDGTVEEELCNVIHELTRMELSRERTSVLSAYQGPVVHLDSIKLQQLSIRKNVNDNIKVI